MISLSRTTAFAICAVLLFTSPGLCGEKIKGEALNNLISGKTVAGKIGKEKRPFIRTCNADGTWFGTNPTKTKGVSTGTWRINNKNQLCMTKNGNPEKCSTVAKDGDKFVQRKIKNNKKEVNFFFFGTNTKHNLKK